MKLTFLGTGTSQGVPVIGCNCEVCRSIDKRDRRLRTSAMVETDDVRLVIDAGPDFRYQMLREGVTKIDGVLLTHEHKDHIGGLDDVRAFNFVDYPHAIHVVDIYAAEHTIRTVRKDFDYAFGDNRYRGVPEIALHAIDEQRPFVVKGVEIIPIVGRHSERFSVTGYRIGPLAYLTDFSSITDNEFAKLNGVEVMVVNALRWAPHSSHMNVEQALQLIERSGAKRSFLTHLSHEIGLYDAAQKRMPEGVTIAYDRLNVTI